MACGVVGGPAGSEGKALGKAVALQVPGCCRPAPGEAALWMEGADGQGLACWGPAPGWTGSWHWPPGIPLPLAFTLARGLGTREVPLLAAASAGSGSEVGRREAPVEEGAGAGWGAPSCDAPLPVKRHPRWWVVGMLLPSCWPSWAGRTSRPRARILPALRSVLEGPVESLAGSVKGVVPCGGVRGDVGGCAMRSRASSVPTGENHSGAWAGHGGSREQGQQGAGAAGNGGATGRRGSRERGQQGSGAAGHRAAGRGGSRPLSCRASEQKAQESVPGFKSVRR